MSHERFSRQIRFAPFGPEGQENLSGATAVIVGCGALGTIQASLLARAGTGTIHLIDRDYVEESNLQRQLLYTEADARQGLPKAEAARRHLLEANSEVRIEAHVSDLNPENADDLLSGAGVILDGTDNFETRFLINDYSVRGGIPWIYGAAVGGYGIAMPIIRRRFRVFPLHLSGAALWRAANLRNGGRARAGYEPDRIPPGDGSDQDPQRQSEKRPPQNLHGRLVARADPRNRHAAARSRLRLLRPATTSPGLNGRRAPVSLCGRNAVQIHELRRPIDLAELALQLEGLGSVRSNEFALRFTHRGS